MLLDDALDGLGVVVAVNDALLALEEAVELFREDVALEVERGLGLERVRDGRVELRVRVRG